MNESQYKSVFFDVANEFNCWIGLREPNPLSLKWIGLEGYTPKPESCKAKSADNEGHALAGLVVDPIKCPMAFTMNSRKLAVGTWTSKFLVNGRLPRGYRCLEHGKEAGLVKYNGSAIHADFDLMAISRANDAGELAFTTEEQQAELFALVGPALNKGLGSPMIQHGAEFMWKGGLGARESEWVLWFGPGNRFKQAMSSMPKEEPH